MDITTTFPLTVTGAELAFRRPRSASRSLWLVLTQATLAAAGVHLLFLLLFWQLGCNELVWLNLGSIALYLVTWRLFRLRLNSWAVGLVWLGVHLHAVFALLALGWDSGFHYYLLTFVPIVFVSSARRLSVKVTMVVVLCSFYMLLDACLRNHPATHALSPLSLAAVRYANIVITFLILGYLTAFYFRQVGEAERRLRHMAGTDTLTGLANRRRIQEVAHYELIKARRSRAALSVVLADIDHFKAINDRHGHQVGDRVLEWVADVLREGVREQDCVSRWGGEEFLILLPDTDLRTAQAVAERLRLAFVGAELPMGSSETLRLTLTLGVSAHGPDDDLHACVARADAALYRGKHLGRDRVVVG